MQVVLLQGRSLLVPYDPLYFGRNSDQLVEEVKRNNGKISTHSRNQGTEIEKCNFSGEASTTSRRFIDCNPYCNGP